MLLLKETESDRIRRDSKKAWRIARATANLPIEEVMKRLPKPGTYARPLHEEPDHTKALLT